MRLSIVTILLPTVLAAQVPLTVHVAPGAPAYSFYGDGPYRAAVPRPDSVLGYPIGTRHTMYHQQQAVLEAMVRAAPDRARLEVTGHSVEGKEMRLVIISSPANIARLDAIRESLGELADPRKSDATRARAIIANTPAVAILSHSIHGNEPSGFEASMLTAYTLLASESPRITRLLDSVVVIINPSQNPDGHERFAAWYNSVAVASPDGAALEQREPWSIQGRFNHYRFDMNRDLLALSQPETRATAGAVLRWHPQLFIDLHSTTAQFFFPPAAAPINANVPEASVSWLEAFGRGNAAAFDQFGWQYYVRDVFDLFYPGYWDTWPSLQGATGMTFETDGGPQLMLRKDDGTITSFREGIAHHVVASLASLETLAKNRSARLTDYRSFFTSAMEPRASIRQVVIGLGPDPRRTREVIDLLRFQGIEVQQANDLVVVPQAHDYLGGTVARRTFPAGSYLIDLVQPRGRLARAILEPEARLDSAFARRQLDRFERNRRRGEDAPREGYEFYDLTAWALPLTQGLDAVWTESALPTASSPVKDLEGRDQVAVQRGRSGYLIPPGTRDAQALALALLGEGFALGVAEEGVRADGVDYPPGTIVIRTVRNADSLYARLQALVRQWPAQVVSVQSAFPDEGRHGIGSESVRAVRAPKILVAAGEGVSQTSFGDVWWYLEHELGQKIVPVDPSRLGSISLANYNVLVLPEGRYTSTLGKSGMEKIRDWVRGGGALIALGSAVSLTEAKDVGLRSVVEDGDSGSATLTAADTAITSRDTPAPFVSPSASGNSSAEYVPGAIARARLEPGHWLRWGYAESDLAVPVPGDFLRPSRTGENVVVFDSDAPILAGFTWPGNTRKFLAGSAWASVESAGRGTVVAFADNPLFRGFWRGPAMLFANAVLFGAGRE